MILYPFRSAKLSSSGISGFGISSMALPAIVCSWPTMPTIDSSNEDLGFPLGPLPAHELAFLVLVVAHVA